MRSYIEHFVPLPDTVWAEFKNLFTPAKLFKEEHFVIGGKVETKIGFLTEGITRTYFIDKEGNEYNKIFNEPPAFIGPYTSMTMQRLNKVYIQALTTCSLVTTDYHSIVELYDKYPIVERFTRKLAESYFAQKEKREIEFVQNTAAQRYRIFQEEFPGLQNKIAQYHIASYLGVTPTQLSRIRAKR